MGHAGRTPQRDRNVLNVVGGGGGVKTFGGGPAGQDGDQPKKLDARLLAAAPLLLASENRFRRKRAASVWGVVGGEVRDNLAPRVATVYRAV